MAKFKQGESGNPGGRPKVLAEVRELARQKAPIVIKELVRLATKAKSEQVRVAAGREVLDRAYGKAGLAIEEAWPAAEHNGKLEVVIVKANHEGRFEDPLREPTNGSRSIATRSANPGAGS